MIHIPVTMPIHAMQTFPGVSCPACGRTFVVLVMCDLETPEGIVQVMKPLDGSIPCPICHEVTPIQKEDPYLEIVKEDKQNLSKGKPKGKEK